MNRRGFFAGTVGLLFGKLFGKPPTYTHVFVMNKLTDEEVRRFTAQWMHNTGKLKYVPVLETNRPFNLVLDVPSKPKHI